MLSHKFEFISSFYIGIEWFQQRIYFSIKFTTTTWCMRVFRFISEISFAFNWIWKQFESWMCLILLTLLSLLSHKTVTMCSRRYVQYSGIVSLNWWKLSKHQLFAPSGTLSSTVHPYLPLLTFTYSIEGRGVGNFLLTVTQFQIVSARTYWAWKGKGNIFVHDYKFERKTHIPTHTHRMLRCKYYENSKFSCISLFQPIKLLI